MNGITRKNKNNKYGAIPKIYNGVKYASTKEANYAMLLDLQVKTSLVASWERQITYKLTVNEVLICRYILDFRITYPDGSIRHIDVKGCKKGQAFKMFELKQKLMQAIHNIIVEIV